MKKNVFTFILLAFLFLVPVLVLCSIREPGTNCYKVTAPARINIYSESKLASNIVADLQPNDILYFCGEKNDN